MDITNLDNIRNNKDLTVGELKELIKDLPDETCIYDIQYTQVKEGLYIPIMFKIKHIIDHIDSTSGNPYNTLLFSSNDINDYMTNENVINKVIYDGGRV